MWDLRKCNFYYFCVINLKAFDNVLHHLLVLIISVNMHKKFFITTLIPSRASNSVLPYFRLYWMYTDVLSALSLDVHQKFEPTVLHHWHVEIFVSLTCSQIVMDFYPWTCSQIVIDFYPWLSQRCSEYQTWNKEKRKGFHLDQRKHFNLTIEISAASTNVIASHIRFAM